MTAPVASDRGSGRGRRCGRCGGWLAPERWGGQTVLRCVSCGRSPDAPAREPTPADLADVAAEAGRGPGFQTLGLTVTDKRNLAAMMTEIGLAVPPAWQAPPPRRRRVSREKPAPDPVPEPVRPLQPELFDLGPYQVGPPPRPRRRRRRKNEPDGTQPELW